MSRLGILNLNNGKPNEALSCFMKCINTDKSNIASFMYAVLCCLTMNNGQDALKLLSEAERTYVDINDNVMEIIEDYRTRAKQLISAKLEKIGSLQ